MDLDPRLLREAERRFGSPRLLTLHQELQPWELDLVERVCGDVRFHDVTVFVRQGDAFALIHKPSDPPGAYWAPAGGVHTGESLEEGARRETLEETGLEVEVVGYLARVDARFTVDDRSRPWTSHVLLAEPRGGRLDPLDRVEIESARWVAATEFRDVVAPVLRASGWGRFAYRLHMADAVYDILGLAGAGGMAAEPAPHSAAGARGDDGDDVATQPAIP